MTNGRQPPAVVVPPGRISTLPPKSVGKRSAAGCGAPAAAIGASGTLRSFHHGLAFGGAAAGPSDTAALPGQCRDALVPSSLVSRLSPQLAPHVISDDWATSG